MLPGLIFYEFNVFCFKFKRVCICFKNLYIRTFEPHYLAGVIILTHQDNAWEQLQETLIFLKEKTRDLPTPQLAIVLGSGLGNFGHRIENALTIPYQEIPNFQAVTVKGHAGNLIFGTVGGKPVVCQQGRYHFYEGHPISETVFPIRVMAHLGATSLLVANAAGGINPNFQVGDIMLIEDHINFQGTNPLIGPNDDRFGPRFPDMTYAYDPKHRALVNTCADELGLSLQRGVYISVTGPSYETPAEIRFFRTIGADAVGMSTVNEVIAANHCGMRVMGLSCIANAAAGMDENRLSHDDVAKAINTMSHQFENLVIKWIESQ